MTMTDEELAKYKEDLKKQLEGLVADNDKEWYQIIESFMNFHPISMTDALKKGIKMVHNWKTEIKRLQDQVNDLHSGMYINCVYCGHRYGPQDKVPASMADVLKKHVEQCPKHPMSELKAENSRLRTELAKHTPTSERSA